jgi:hypothetical protein
MSILLAFLSVGCTAIGYEFPCQLPSAAHRALRRVDEQHLGLLPSFQRLFCPGSELRLAVLLAVLLPGCLCF